jgi:hypothetical protein
MHSTWQRLHDGQYVQCTWFGCALASECCTTRVFGTLVHGYGECCMVQLDSKEPMSLYVAEPQMI